MTLLSNIASENTLWLIASASRKFAIVRVAKRLGKKGERCTARLRDLGQNRHDDDVMTMGGDGGDDDVNDDAV